MVFFTFTHLSLRCRNACRVPFSLFMTLLSCSVFPFFNTEICSVDCGSHGVCMGGTCRCEEGWTGPACNQRACHPRCAEHGTCKDGKCECSQGWNGEHCTIGRPAALLYLSSSYNESVCYFSPWKSLFLLINFYSFFLNNYFLSKVIIVQ